MLLTFTFILNLICSRYPNFCDHLILHPHPAPRPVLASNYQYKTTRARTLFQDQKENELSSGFKSEPFVETRSGALEGYIMRVMSGREIFAFEGIPFAEPPTGSNRFRPPRAKAPWGGILHAKKPGADCLQWTYSRFLRVVGNENCLFLNIYAPKMYRYTSLEFSPKIPVIIFIHGGSFFMGSGREYGPSYLLHQDVILVTINYRLGVLGFFSTGDEESLGNWGLRDQSMAIKWVSENVEFFGGDSKKITLAGQSAGAASVHLQMLSTSSISHGLFSRAISFSGSAFNSWALMSSKSRIQTLNKKLARITGCPKRPNNNNPKAFVSCLRRMDGNFLVAAQRGIYGAFKIPLLLFIPVIEPNVTGAFISQTPDHYYEEGLVMKIPYMSTNTDMESGSMFMLLDSLNISPYIFQNWRHFQQYFLDLHGFTDGYPHDQPLGEIVDVLAKAYFGSENIHDNGLRMNRTIFKELTSDSFFTVANRKALKAHGKVAPTYSYIYKFRGASSMANTAFQDYRKWEATHSDDLASVFNSTIMFNPIRRNSRHHKLSQELTELLTTFADEGIPHLKVQSSYDKVDKYIWKPTEDESRDKLQFLEIGIKGEFRMIEESPDKEWKLRLWDKLGF